MKSFSVRLTIGALSLVGSLSAAHINLLGNSSFENGYGSSLWEVMPTIDAWSMGYPSWGVELQRNNVHNVTSNSPTGQNAYSGQQWAEIDWHVGDMEIGQTAIPQIYQDVVTTPGTTYVLSFYYTARHDGGTQEMGVFWKGPASWEPWSKPLGFK
jgi:hypothetical protein